MQVRDVRFELACLAQGDDDLPFDIYADWLAENGDESADTLRYVENDLQRVDRWARIAMRYIYREGPPKEFVVTYDFMQMVHAYIRHTRDDLGADILDYHDHVAIRGVPIRC